MSVNINTFRSKFSGGGARANQFEVIMTGPVFAALNIEQFAYMCKASSHPAAVTGAYSTKYMGRDVWHDGDRVFEDWTVQIYNDENFQIRRALLRWQAAMASFSTTSNSQRQLGATANPNSYVGTAIVNQLGKMGSVVQSYTLINVFPTVVGPIELSWDSQDTVEEFSVTFKYDYWIDPANGVI